MGNTPIFQCPILQKEQKETQPYFMFYRKLSKIILDCISEVINLKYAFNILFKITLKTIIMGTFLQFHDSVQLIILRTLGSEILLPKWAEKKPLWSPGALFQKMTETLIYNSTSFLRSNLSQYRKAFSLSATPVAYESLDLIPHFI